MSNYSSREAAQLLGISPSALAQFVRNGKVSGPMFVIPGKRNTNLWPEEQIARLRNRMPRLVKGTRIGKKYKLAKKPMTKMVFKKRGRKKKVRSRAERAAAARPVRKVRRKKK